MSSSEGISDSQTSHVSNLSLGLSQETMNQVMGAVGLSSVVGDRLLEEFHADLEDDPGEAEGEGEGEGEREMVEADDCDASASLEGSSSISISRAVFFANSQGSSSDKSDNSASQYLPCSPPSPHSTPSTAHTPSTSYSWNSSTCAGNGVSPTLLSSPIPPPLAQMHLSTSPLQHLPLSQAHNPHPSQFTLRSPMTPNVPFPGLYGFMLCLDSRHVSSSKCPNLLYSTEVQRMYIKRDALVPLTFLTTTPLPPMAYILAMAIHKQPEMISENLHCCAKHVDDLRRRGIVHPFHFIRSPMDNCSYRGDPDLQRLSIALPLSSLQKAGETEYTALYQFPCFTSDFQRAGQLVQLIFTLECETGTMGRATLDVRVCASPGRDKTVEEKKWRQRKSNSATVGQESVGRRGRKRAAPAREEVQQCTLRPTKVCRVTSAKEDLTIRTFPEIFPHINECVRLLEKVYMVPVDVDGASSVGPAQPPPPPFPRQDSFPSLERWLDSLGLSQYLSLFNRQGVRDTFQALSLTDSELKTWGITERHRKSILDGAATLQERPPTLLSSQPLSALPSSQPLSTTTAATQPFSFEVLQIQARKTIK